MSAYANSAGVSNSVFMQNNNLKNSDMKTKDTTIEDAYLAGFEPSSDDLSDKDLYAEALEYLRNLTIQ